MKKSWILLLLFALAIISSGCSKKTGCPSLDKDSKMDNPGLFDKKMR